MPERTRTILGDIDEEEGLAPKREEQGACFDPPFLNRWAKPVDHRRIRELR